MSQPQQVDVGQLSIDQLNQLRKSLSEEVQHITSQYGNLKVAHNRFTQSLKALEEFTPEHKDQPILVPITSSMYVPGQLSSIESVLVDIGTGYFVDKSIPDAAAYTKGKLAMIQQNLQVTSQTIMSKRKDLETVTRVLQQKAVMQQQMEAQGAQSGQQVIS